MSERKTDEEMALEIKRFRLLAFEAEQEIRWHEEQLVYWQGMLDHRRRWAEACSTDLDSRLRSDAYKRIYQSRKELVRGE